MKQIQLIGAAFIFFAALNANAGKCLYLTCDAQGELDGKFTAVPQKSCDKVCTGDLGWAVSEPIDLDIQAMGLKQYPKVQPAQWAPVVVTGLGTTSEPLAIKFQKDIQYHPGRATVALDKFFRSSGCLKSNHSVCAGSQVDQVEIFEGNAWPKNCEVNIYGNETCEKANFARSLDHSGKLKGESVQILALNGDQSQILFMKSNGEKQYVESKLFDHPLVKTQGCLGGFCVDQVVKDRDGTDVVIAGIEVNGGFVLRRSHLPESGDDDGFSYRPSFSVDEIKKDLHDFGCSQGFCVGQRVETARSPFQKGTIARINYDESLSVDLDRTEKICKEVSTGSWLNQETSEQCHDQNVQGIWKAKQLRHF